MHGGEREASSGLQPSDRAADDAFVEPRVFGKHADRVDQIETRWAEIMAEEIGLDERD